MKKSSEKPQYLLKEHMPDRFTRIIFLITLLLFVSSLIFAAISEEPAQISRMVFNAVSCFFMLLLLILPVFVRKFFKVKIPRSFQVIYVAFAFCGIVLGDVINFFDRFKYWDSLLHFFSGVLLASLGFVLINTLNKADSVSLQLSPVLLPFLFFVSPWRSARSGKFWNTPSTIFLEQARRLIWSPRAARSEERTPFRWWDTKH